MLFTAHKNWSYFDSFFEEPLHITTVLIVILSLINKMLDMPQQGFDQYSYLTCFDCMQCFHIFTVVLQEHLL